MSGRGSGFVYKPDRSDDDQHECHPPTVGLTHTPNAPEGSVWRCRCGQVWVAVWMYNPGFPDRWGQWRRARWLMRWRWRNAPVLGNQSVQPPR